MIYKVWRTRKTRDEGSLQPSTINVDIVKNKARISSEWMVTDGSEFSRDALTTKQLKHIENLFIPWEIFFAKNHLICMWCSHLYKEISLFPFLLSSLRNRYWCSSLYWPPTLEQEQAVDFLSLPYFRRPIIMSSFIMHLDCCKWKFELISL